MSALPKILIVDDDHDSLDLLEVFLYKHYDIITAMNGFEALSRMESERPQLIITDIKMPVMDGIRFLNSLRRHSSTRSVPVIAITSFNQEHTIKSLTNIGFNGILAKPLDGKSALDLISGLIKNASIKKR